uniref:transposase n=1 Tax=Wolbachia endosymbiont (group A) of Yponomeuta plumbellus TaxID=2954068 RepID=UPI00222FFEFE|nr:transposase [Wolbachia endosymbiont (group A) of Yponomeuta plumbellus]
MTNRREYTAEFKLEAVKLTNEQRKAGQTITKIARDLGIKGGLLGKWIKKHNEKKSAADAFPGRGNMAPYDKERFDLQSKSNKRKRHFKKSPGQSKRVKYFFI